MLKTIKSLFLWAHYNVKNLFDLYKKKSSSKTSWIYFDWTYRGQLLNYSDYLERAAFLAAAKLANEKRRQANHNTYMNQTLSWDRHDIKAIIKGNNT